MILNYFKLILVKGIIRICKDKFGYILLGVDFCIKYWDEIIVILLYFEWLFVF